MAHALPFFALFSGTGLDEMMDEAVALAMASSTAGDTEDLDENEEETIDSSTTPSTPRNQSTPPRKSNSPNVCEAQQQANYYRRNEELNLAQRYAPENNCWLLGFLMRGPFQLCMKS